jgi:hypothetical protein
LADDLRSVGLSHGVKFARSGRVLHRGPKVGIFPMCCQCGVFYRTNPAAKSCTKTENVAGFTYKANIKVQSLVNQRKNCRAPSATGEALPKKCRTNRPQKGTSVTCKARLTFYVDPDHDRFMIKAFNGQRLHSNHHQVKAEEITTGTKDLSDETRRLVVSTQWTSTPTWSNSAWAHKLTDKGEGLLLQRLKSSSKYDHVRVNSSVWYVRAKESSYPPLASHSPVPRFVHTRTVEIKKYRGEEYIVCDCHRYDRTKVACEHVIHVLSSLNVDLSSYHLAGVRWTKNYLMKYGALNTSEILRDAFERSLQHPGVPFHPSTSTHFIKWTGPSFSCSGLTMSDFRPSSLGLPPLAYNYPEATAKYLRHQQSTALGANVSQVLVTTPLFTSPILGKADSEENPWPQVTPESPLLQPPSSPYQDDSQADGQRHYFVAKDHLADISRLCEGHDHLEKFVDQLLLLAKGVISGSHSCQQTREKIENFSSQYTATFSQGQPASHLAMLSQATRVLLPTHQEMHSFNASVETKALYTRKRRADEMHRSGK